MEEDLESILDAYVYEINDVQTRRYIVQSISHYLENRRQNNLLYDYRVNDVTTLVDVDNNNINIEIIYQLSRLPDMRIMNIQINRNIPNGLSIEPRKSIKKHIL